MLVVKDKTFRPYFSPEHIAARVAELGAEISADYAGEELLIIPILNGSFVFAADLARHITIPCQFSFIKVSSYAYTASKGEVEELLGLKESLTGRHVLLVEDIVDTGLTMHEVVRNMQAERPASLKIATFLAKPASIQKPISLEYVGFQIAPDFVVGYGMDYDGYGRELPGLWVLDEEK